MNAQNERPIRVEHVLQPALLVRSLDATLDRLQALFGMYPSERVRIRFAGVDNAVYALGDQTFLELIEPFVPESSAGKLLARTGEGWHMLSVDLEPVEKDAVERWLESAGMRVVHRGSSRGVDAAWHIHPRDTGGVLLLLARRTDRDENGAWAGWSWRDYVRTNTRVVRSILGVSVATADLETARERWESLGFDFGAPREDAGDAVLQADAGRGTFLQLRSPSRVGAPSRAWLDHFGPGLFHLVLAAPDLDAARARLERVGVVIERELEVDADGASGSMVRARSIWTRPDTTCGVPMELREAAARVQRQPGRPTASRPDTHPT
jgi:catechol 2,3-dioxygenase-like lactoylglutathione lyase family enzyme